MTVLHVSIEVLFARGLLLVSYPYVTVYMTLIFMPPPDLLNRYTDRAHTFTQGCETVARMAAIGFGLPEDAFIKMMARAPHLLGTWAVRG